MSVKEQITQRPYTAALLRPFSTDLIAADADSLPEVMPSWSSYMYVFIHQSWYQYNKQITNTTLSIINY